jgi:hypothetical protein
MGRIRAKACRAFARGLGGLLWGGWATGLSLREGMGVGPEGADLLGVVVGPEGADLRGVRFGRYFWYRDLQVFAWFFRRWFAGVIATGASLLQGL